MENVGMVVNHAINVWASWGARVLCAHRSLQDEMSSLLVFHRVYRLEIQSVMLVFLTPLVNFCPSTFSLTSPTPPPLPK